MIDYLKMVGAVLAIMALMAIPAIPGTWMIISFGWIGAIGYMALIALFVPAVVIGVERL